MEAVYIRLLPQAVINGADAIKTASFFLEHLRIQFKILFSDGVDWRRIRVT